MPRAGDLVDASASVSETIRALDELGRWSESIGWPNVGGWIAAERRSVEEGTFEGALWIGPKDEAAALVRWRPRGRSARGAFLFFLPGYRHLPTVRSLLEKIEAMPGTVVDLYRFEGTALDPPDLAPLLERRGFRRLVRFDMVYPAARPLPPRAGTLEGLRPARPEDEAALAELLFDAYSDFPLDILLSGDTPGREGARAAVRSLLDGTYGRPWPGASLVVERAGALAAAVLVNDFHGPLIAEVMVARGHRRQGLARRLLAESLAALRGSGAPVPRLVVTAVNRRARRLYESLGFVLEPLPPDSSWLNPGRRSAPEVTELLPSYLDRSPSPAAERS